MINIRPDESLLYEKYFSKCDEDKSGKISIIETKKFLLKSSLSNDDINKISEYSGANRLGYFGRSQFYVALKAVALRQSGYELNPEIIRLEVNHKSPKFDAEVDEDVIKQLYAKENESVDINKTPIKTHKRALSSTIQLDKLHSNLITKRSQIRQHANSVSNTRPILTNQDPHFIDAIIPQSEFTSTINPTGDEEDDEDADYEDNKGLLNPNIKFDLSEVFVKHFDSCSKSNSSSSNRNSDANSDSSLSSSSENSDVNDEYNVLNHTSFDVHKHNSDYVDDADGVNQSHDSRINNRCDSPREITGYQLMEPVDCFASTPKTSDSTESIPVASLEQLEYYTKCFQTLPHYDNDNVLGQDAIEFFNLYKLPEHILNQILDMTVISPDIPHGIVSFSRALHLIIHVKRGFHIPNSLPSGFLPKEFELPDEPFSFDLSTGDQQDTANPSVSSPIIRSHMNPPLNLNDFSTNDEDTTLDYVDISIHRNWSRDKKLMNHNATNPGSGLSVDYPSTTINLQYPRLSDPIQSCSGTSDTPTTLSRPRPTTKRSLTLPRQLATTQKVIQSSSPESIEPPPPPPRSNMSLNRQSSLDMPKSSRSPLCTVDANIEMMSQDPISSASSCSSIFSESSSSSSVSSNCSSTTDRSNYSLHDDTMTGKRVKNQEQRRHIQLVIRELKSKNHVLLRLNNEMTTELDELREQRLNLHLQLDYMHQQHQSSSQLDIS